MTHDESRRRRDAIFDAVAGGMTRRQAALAFGVSLATAYEASRGLARARPGPAPRGPDARASRMIEMHRAGLTLQQIGDRYGVTRERARQIIKRHGNGAMGGRRKVTIANKIRCEAERERLHIERFGCTRAERKAIKAVPNAWRAYQEQRHSAFNRGIEWALTLEQWWDIWEQSGHWPERGRGRDRYCMARVADTGGYVLGNVYITTMRENGQEYQLRRDKSKRSANTGVYKLFPGLAKPYVARYGRKRLGHFSTEGDAVAARRAYVQQLRAA